MKSYLCISLVSRVYKAKTCPIQSIQHHSKWGAISGEQIPPDVLFFKYRGKATPLFPMPFALFRRKKKTGQMREMCVGVKSIESNTKQRALGVSAEFGIVYI